MRALFFLDAFAGGGAEKVCLNLAEELFNLGIESDFVTVFNTESSYDIPDYIHIFSLGLNNPFLTRFSLIKWVPRINQFILGKEYVLITAHLQTAQYLASLTRVRKNVLYVMHGSQHLNHRYNSWCYKMGFRWLMRNKKIITVSLGLQNELVNEYDIDIENIKTIYNPCILGKCEKECKSISPHIRPYFLFMGRLEDVKNPLLALELFYKGAFYEKYDLLYLGDGSLKDILYKKINDYNLIDHVFLIGFQKNVNKWLMNASLLISCSKQEGFPMGLVEALVWKIPVVALDCPYGPREILIDELDKYLISPKEKLENSISIIMSALECYPEITKKYYVRFDGKFIVQMYLRTWKEFFCSEKVAL